MTLGLHTCVNAYEHTYTHICTHVPIPHAYPGSQEDELEEEEREVAGKALCLMGVLSLVFPSSG